MSLASSLKKKKKNGNRKLKSKLYLINVLLLCYLSNSRSCLEMMMDSWLCPLCPILARIEFSPRQQMRKVIRVKPTCFKLNTWIECFILIIIREKIALRKLILIICQEFNNKIFAKMEYIMSVGLTSYVEIEIN